MDACSGRHQGNCCASTREIPATGISIRTQRTEIFSCDKRCHAVSTFGSRSVRKRTCSCDNTAAFARCEHTWISLRAQRCVFRRKNGCLLTPGAHLDLAPCAKRRVPSKRPLRSHAASTLGSVSVRKKTCSCDNTAAFARFGHTWISLRAQRCVFRRKNCCLLTPGAHLDLAPCAKRHVPSKRLLRSHAASTLGSLSVRKQEDMFMRQTYRICNRPLQAATNWCTCPL